MIIGNDERWESKSQVAMISTWSTTSFFNMDANSENTSNSVLLCVYITVNTVGSKYNTI